MACGTILKNMKDRMFRVKELPSYESLEKTGLAKVLGVVDLLSLGIGSTIGVGIYVIAGQVARLYCGPSIFISFLIAGIASLLAGMCYAEFAARVPRAGSAYVYSYVTVGEFMAFIIGWTLVLEHAIGSAAITRAGSAYIDSVTGNKMSQFFRTYMPIDISIFASYPDLFAFSIDFVLTLLLIIGVKESSRFNCIFTSINISMVLFTIGFFLSKADIKNWQTETKDIPKSAHAGTGGFFPYGVDGMLTGAAVTFYTYVGFDTVATAGEETKNPKRDIPLSIILTITIVAVIYILMSMSLTLVTPYYKIDPVVSVPLIFDSMGWYIPKYFVYAGAFCGLATSLVGALFPLPRILYAMGLDDVLFPFFATISERFKTPAIATLIGGTLTGLIATMFSVEELISMYSIGTLQSYALVSVCVIILRYRQQNTDGKLENEQFHLKYLFMPVSDKPTAVTEKIVKIVITLMCLITILLTVFMRINGRGLLSTWYGICIITLCCFGIFFCILITSRQPQNDITKDRFQVPLLPWIPSFSVFINIYLMTKLSTVTWIRFAIWMTVGFVLYFGYGLYKGMKNIQGINIDDDKVYDDKEDILLINKSDNK